MTPTTNEDAIFEAVTGLLGRHRPAGAVVTPATELGADLNIDSVAAMDLIMEIEDHFEIDIPVNQVGDMRTVGDLAGLVRKEVAAKQG
ncbi:MAG: hypothetical protein KDG89_06840 [Geminicoccaceae bacterium]|nr:hypothetical protein [Geminicoccaceae bacterium]